eukprot:147418_1
MMGTTRSIPSKKSTTNTVNTVMTRKTKDLLTVYGYFHSHYASNNYTLFPMELIDLCFSFYHIQFEILKFDTKFKREEVTFTYGNTCMAEQTTENRRYKWALCDITPVKSGIHCWRYKIVNPKKNWFSTCIAKPMLYSNDGTSKHNTAYGVGTDPNWYPYTYQSANRFKNTNKNHKGTWRYPDMDTFHIDMLFNADIGKLEFCVLEMKHILNVKIWDVPCDTEQGFVPYFNTISLKKSSVQIASIPVESYGEQIDNIFEQL